MPVDSNFESLSKSELCYRYIQIGSCWNAAIKGPKIASRATIAKAIVAIDLKTELRTIKSFIQNFYFFILYDSYLLKQFGSANIVFRTCRYNKLPDDVLKDEN